MVFSSITFLFFFLPAVIVGYYVVPRRWRNLLLLLASLLFYLWGAGSIVLVLLVSIAINDVLGLGVERAMDGGRRGRARLILAAAVVLNVGLLAWFKYANFTVDILDGLLVGAGREALPWTTIVLPIGISFYTFHSLSYLVDIYRGHGPAPGLARSTSPCTSRSSRSSWPARSCASTRSATSSCERTETTSTFVAGIYRFSHGLGKKVLIADTVAPVADAIFATPPGELGTAAALLGVVAYAVQLYFDFSGYSDMALGLAMMFGIHLPENFARPYAARSVTEFWRRWHMSLSRWFRDYLYIPLGGNRGSALRHLPEPDHRVPGHRPVARRGLDVRAVGRPARRCTCWSSAWPGSVARPTTTARTASARRAPSCSSCSPGSCSARPTWTTRWGYMGALLRALAGAPRRGGTGPGPAGGHRHRHRLRQRPAAP